MRTTLSEWVRRARNPDEGMAAGNGAFDADDDKQDQGCVHNTHAKAGDFKVVPEQLILNV
jgi:hypothetical protein